MALYILNFFVLLNILTLSLDSGQKAYIRLPHITNIDLLNVN